jgi:hypothetical protein
MTRAHGSARRLAIVGLTAGLLGGGAAGLTIALPSSVGAQTSSTTAPTATPVETPTTPRQGHDQRLRAALQPLVDDSTLTPGQVDAVVAALAADRPPRERLGHGGRHRSTGSLNVIAPLLGATADEVRTALHNGTSIAAQAEAAGVPIDTIIDALSAQMAGRVPDARERIAQMLERSGPGPRGGRAHR